MYSSQSSDIVDEKCLQIYSDTVRMSETDEA